jgi:DNA polymerase-1
LTDIALVDDKGVEQMYGVSPKEFIDVKALKGDPSDNIPGVVGIGEKTSVELVKRFASLENIFRNLSKLPPRVQTLLAGHEKEALANRSLVTIRCDAPLEISLDRLEWSEQNLTKAIPTLEKYRMKSLVKRIKEPSTQTTHKKRAETAGPNVEQGQLL